MWHIYACVHPDERMSDDINAGSSSRAVAGCVLLRLRAPGAGGPCLQTWRARPDAGARVPKRRVSEGDATGGRRGERDVTADIRSSIIVRIRT